ncbi:hypothetical protein FD723_39310 (plasmid) [Nostoc sp. C052]|uniref:DUF5676 family membrane protein n=1 Tax=Nostoc sp. C052 TaxID=2576902 RepID=UPI0015C3ECAA|nr:DUF5676 family membrane protein [Nostoc sp. C052]QLE46244.1 hypothetical protein FD723_39310 [Nostoc sp. C052]
MTHSIQHSVGNRVCSYTVPILSVRSLFLATAITTGIAYLVCVLFLIVAPQATMGFFSYVLHANLSGIIRSVTWGSFIVGLLVWSMGIGLYVALVARLYNKLSVR